MIVSVANLISHAKAGQASMRELAPEQVVRIASDKLSTAKPGEATIAKPEDVAAAERSYLELQLRLGFRAQLAMQGDDQPEQPFRDAFYAYLAERDERQARSASPAHLNDVTA